MEMKLMKRWMTALVLSATALSVMAQETGAEKVKVGDPLPSFTLESVGGEKVSSADLKGKVVLVSLFATWCGPCQLELAEVERTLWPKYGKDAGFCLLVVGREHTAAELEAYGKRKKFSFPLYPDPDRSVFSLFADQSIPRAYLFGKDGKLVYSSLGYSADDFEKLMAAIEKALRD